jgi:Tol biopolymer transport system component/predicted Ser/Thr protein kinase
MPLSAGEKMGPYEIVAPIGAGGMGEVYQARDTRLGREVAIKVSAERFSERFEREAKAIASLNHPNICTLYDVGPNYLVMELVEGPTLADELKNGPLALEEALGIARQIADALEAAHEKGVVHRDLKPGNIKIKPDGTVKVLDFGLAKMGNTPAVHSDNSPTISMAMTEAGMILGTASYMAPEQAKGRPADRRADVYAFGVVLYEMLTGARLHGGESAAEVLASVIKEEPKLENAPAPVRRLLRRCLEKDPQKRLRHIGDVMALVDEAPASATVAASAAVAVPRGGRVWPVVAAVATGAALVLAGLYFRPKPAAPAEITRFDIVQTNDVAFSDSFAISPDGRKLAFVGAGAGRSPQIWIRSFDSVEARPLTAEGVNGVAFWSPDSRYLVFSIPGKLQKIDTSGGPPQTLCDVTAPVLGGFWTRDGRIVFGINAASPLLQVSAAGGAATPMATPADKENAHAFPVLLPDGHHFVYWALGGQSAGVYLGSLDATPGEAGLKKLLPDSSVVAFAPASESSAGNGSLVFRRNGTLMTQLFDTKRLEMAGQAVPVVERVAAFSVSNTGVLVYRAGGAQTFHLAWFDRQGKPLENAGDTDVLPTPAPSLSPDGKRAAYSRNDSQSGNTDIWLYDLARGVPTRFTFDLAIDAGPVWSPDGTKIVFARGPVSNTADIYQKASDMSGSEQLVLKGGGLPLSWSHDGRFLLYQTAMNPKMRLDVWVLPMTGAGERKPWPFANTEFNERGPRFSPDGRFVSYISDESGRSEVYVRPFDPSVTTGSAAGGAKYQVSKDGGDGAHWRGDGKEILYMAPGGTVMSVDVTTTPVFQILGVPKPLFKSAAVAQFWDLTPDGKRLLVPVPLGVISAAPYRVTLNWTAARER